MIEKIKQFQENLKKNQKFSDIKLNLKDCYKNFCLDSFIQHFFSKLIILIQLCFIARLFRENSDKESFLVNYVIIFAVGFSTWKIFSVFFEYLNEFSLIKFLKLMNKKDYFALGVIYRKIILLSLAYLIVFYIPFVFVIQNTLNNQLLFKSLEIGVVYAKCNHLYLSNLESNHSLKLQNKELFFKEALNNSLNEIIPQLNYSGKSQAKLYLGDDINVFFKEQDKKFWMNREEIKSNLETENMVNNNAKNNGVYLIKENIDNLLHFQYLYFFVLLIRIFNKPILNIFFVFKYNKYMNFMMATKFKINFCLILFCYKNEFNFLNSIFLADLISELFVFTYLMVVLTIYNPFPQVWIMPSLGIFNIDISLLQKILQMKKILKFFFLSNWNDFIFLLFIFLKIYFYNEHKKYEIYFSNKEPKQSDFPLILENINKEVANLKINIGNFFLLIALKEFFFNISKYTKRNYYRIFLDNIQMISFIKNINEEEKHIKNLNSIQLENQNDFQNYEKNKSLDNYNKPLLDNKIKIKKACDAISYSIGDKKTSKGGSDLNNHKNNLNLTTHLEKLDSNVQNKKLKSSIDLRNNIDNNYNNQNILVVIKNKIFVSLILSCIVFINILILYLIGIFKYFNPINAGELNNYFSINYSFLLILFICSSINYLATELFIINDFLDNPNDDKIIIYGFCLFSFFPFLVLVIFISNSGFLFFIINIVNVYFIYTFNDFLSNIDLRFKKIEFMINKEMLEI